MDNSEWSANDVINIRMALGRKKVPHPAPVAQRLAVKVGCAGFSSRLGQAVLSLHVAPVYSCGLVAGSSSNINSFLHHPHTPLLQSVLPYGKVVVVVVMCHVVCQCFWQFCDIARLLS